jgi:hypothetical protein
VWEVGFLLNGGLILMWTANLTNLATKGGFTGIAGWLGPGIIVVMMRGWYLAKRLLKEWRTLSKKERRRILFTQVFPTVFNLLANVAADCLIVHNLSTGSLKWGRWDWVCTYFAVGTIITMTMLRYILNWWWRKRLPRKRMSPKVYVAGMALGTRAFQQGMLVKSPQLRQIPWGTPVGLFSIASMQFWVSFVEYKAAKEEQSLGHKEALLVAWADGSNFVAAFILIVGWSITTGLLFA